MEFLRLRDVLRKPLSTPADSVAAAVVVVVVVVVALVVDGEVALRGDGGSNNASVGSSVASSDWSGSLGRSLELKRRLRYLIPSLNPLKEDMSLLMTAAWMRGGVNGMRVTPQLLKS